MMVVLEKPSDEDLVRLDRFLCIRGSIKTRRNQHRLSISD
jgi:ribosomal 50S subunit-recycling heat shock protein